jgi:hypothetical protein
MATPKKTLLEFLDQNPPFWCFALARNREARKKASRLSREEISKRSGLSLRTIDRITSRISWRGVRVDQASAFLVGCGTDLFHVNVDKNFVLNVVRRGVQFPHLTAVQLKALNQRVERFQAAKASATRSYQSQG